MVWKRPLAAGLLTLLRVPLVLIVLLGTILLLPRRAEAQELGHKLLGAVGINAGTQSEPGLYLLERLVFYSAEKLRDRNGAVIPIRGLEIDATSSVFGLSYTVKPAGGPFYTVAIGAPLAHVSANADNPHLGIDASGFGDLFVQPVKLGGRFDRFDIVASYAFYAPIGHFEPKRLSVGRGYWTHEFSAGGAVYLDRERTGRFSMLASYDINRRKRDIDITRGNTVQVQGGAGARIYGPLDAGIAGFALWQVTDNTVGAPAHRARCAHTRLRTGTRDRRDDPQHSHALRPACRMGVRRSRPPGRLDPREQRDLRRLAPHAWRARPGASALSAAHGVCVAAISRALIALRSTDSPRR